MREHTGEPRSGPQHHVRRLIHGANGLGTDQGLGRGETKPRNASGHRGDLGLPDHLAFRATHIHDVGNHIDGLQTVRQDATPGTENGRESIKTGNDVARLVPQCHQKQVAERVPMDITRPAEAMLQYPPPQAFIGQCGNSHAQISRGENAQVSPQSTAGATVIPGANNRGRFEVQLTQGLEGYRETVSPTQGDDTSVHAHSRPRSRWTTRDSTPWRTRRAARSSASATLRCLPPVQPTATVT